MANISHRAEEAACIGSGRHSEQTSVFVKLAGNSVRCWVDKGWKPPGRSELSSTLAGSAVLSACLTGK